MVVLLSILLQYRVTRILYRPIIKLRASSPGAVKRQEKLFHFLFGLNSTRCDFCTLMTRRTMSSTIQFLDAVCLDQGRRFNEN